MESDQALTELRSRVDDLQIGFVDLEAQVRELRTGLGAVESGLGGAAATFGPRVEVLERQIRSLSSPVPTIIDTVPPPPTGPPVGPPTAGPPPPTAGAPPGPAPTAAPPAGTPPAGTPSTGIPHGAPVGPPPPTGPPAGPTVIPGRSRPSFEVGTEVLLRWAGLSLVVLAALFLVSTAISRGWIGPELQLLGATAIGAGLLAGALWLVEERRGFALALGNGGAAVLIVCAGAAHIWLGLYDALTGLIMVAVAAVISLSAAIKLRMESVAVTATGAMLLVPTWARIIAEAPVSATGIWLGLFAILATAVGLQREWSLYRLVSTWSAGLWVLGLAAVLSDSGNTDHALAGAILAAVVGLVLWANPALSERRASSGGSGASSSLAALVRGSEHRAAVLVPVWLWSTVLSFSGWSPDHPGGLFGLALASGFLALALLAGPLERWISDATFASHLLGAGLLITVSTLAWVGGPTLMVVVAVQALATLVLAHHVPDRWLTLNAYLLGSLALLLLAAGLMEVVESDRSSAADNLAHGAVVAVSIAVAWLTAKREDGAVVEVVNGVVWLAGLSWIGSMLWPSIDDRGWLPIGMIMALAGMAAPRLGVLVRALSVTIGGITIIAAGGSIISAAADGAGLLGHLANLSVVAGLVAVTVIVWTMTERPESAGPLFVASWVGALSWVASVLLAAPQGQVAVSIAWAVAAGAAIVAGVRSDESVVRIVGLGTLGIVLTKLLTVDLAEVDTLWRVGLFMVIGLGLLRLGYLLPAMAERYGQDESSTGKPDSEPTAAGPGGQQ